MKKTETDIQIRNQLIETETKVQKQKQMFKLNDEKGIKSVYSLII